MNTASSHEYDLNTEVSRYSLSAVVEIIVQLYIFVARNTREGKFPVHLWGIGGS